MRKALLWALVLFSVSAFAKDRNWQTGKLLHLDIQMSKGDADVQLFTGKYGTTGTVDSEDESLYIVRVEDSKYIYTAGRKLYPHKWGQRAPRFTENASVEFAIDGDSFILLDDTGKEFKMKLGKRTAKD